MESDCVALAARGGHVVIIRMLLAGGAQTGRVASTGCTALYLVETNGHKEVVAQLRHWGEESQSTQ